jgi:hypothetical protein
MTLSALWEEVPRQTVEKGHMSSSALSYDTFVLALDFLFLIGSVELEDGLMARKSL